jgi:Holliday junction resolvase RusA-like endonuclease
MFFNRDFIVHLATELGRKPVDIMNAITGAANVQEKIVLDIEPMATPRPRAAAQKLGNKMTARVYHPTEYTEYKLDITEMLLAIERLEQKRYYGLAAVLYLPFPVGEAKKRTYENRPHEKKPDFDNLIKGFVDALVSSGIVIEDGHLHTNMILKRYTVNETGRIEFNLYKYSEI